MHKLFHAQQRMPGRTEVPALMHLPKRADSCTIRLGAMHWEGDNQAVGDGEIRQESGD